MSATPDARDFGFEDFPGNELHAHLSELREAFGPVAPAKFLGQPSWVIVGYEALAGAFRDGESFPPPEIYRMGIEPVIGRNFQTMDGAEHRLHRKIATPAFRPRIVSQYERAGFEETAHELIDRFDGRAEVDLAEVFTRLYPFVVITRLLGIPRDYEAQFHGWAEGMLTFMRDAEQAHACSREFGEYLAPVIEARRRNPGDDILSALIHSSVDGVSLSNDEIGSTARLLFAAGATTTHDAIGNLVYVLLTHEGAWEQLRAEPDLRETAVSELLRWEPPVAVLPRTTGTSEIEIADAILPANSIVLFGITGANRDPELFAEPDRFDPSRKPDVPLMTFGPGLRQCPGMHLASRQIRIALDVLLDRFPALALADEPRARPRGTAIRGPAALPVHLRK